MLEATLDADFSARLPMQMASARQAALAWWAAQSRERAWCDQCCRALAWGEGYLVPAAEVQSRRELTAWLVCERCWGERVKMGGGGDSVGDGQPDKASSQV